MTVIVALKHEERVFVAADSATGGGYDCTASDEPKLFVNGRFLVGVTGSWRLAQLLRYDPEIGALEPGSDAHRFMVTEFVPVLRKLVDESGFKKTKDGVDSLDNCSFVVAWGAECFAVRADLQVSPLLPGGYLAVGAGVDYALGSLWSTQGEPWDERLYRALMSATVYSAYVEPPFVIRNTRDSVVVERSDVVCTSARAR